jgi:RNA polymerase sigma-70 factor (ECF subfamily)
MKVRQAADMKTVTVEREQQLVVGKLDAEALFRAHAAFVAAFLQRLGTPPSEVDDLVQEVFLIAHRKGGYVPGSGQPRTWLGAIAVHVAQNGRRSRNRRESADHERVERSVSARPDPAQALDVRRSLERVQSALDSIDIEQRAAFVLYEIDGESCESIALAFAVPVGTVYSRLHYARKRFLEAYAALGHAGPARGHSTRSAEGR